MFENGHIAADQVSFFELNSKKSATIATLAAHERQSFNFKKTAGTLQINFLFYCIYLPFTPRKTCENENSKLKIVKHFILGPKNGHKGKK